MVNRKKSHLYPSMSVEWTEQGPTFVEIHKFEQLTPVKIDKCFEAVMKEWYRLRATSIHERRKRERRESVGAENG